MRKKMSQPEFRHLLETTRDRILARMRRDGFYKFIDFGIHFDAEAYDINRGECETFANEVEDLVIGAKSVWLEEIHPRFVCVGHCVVQYSGKYYDAECLDGVTDPSDLPCVRNLNRPRADVLAERKMASCQQSV